MQCAHITFLRDNVLHSQMDKVNSLLQGLKDPKPPHSVFACQAGEQLGGLAKNKAFVSRNYCVDRLHRAE